MNQLLAFRKRINFYS